MLMLPEFAGRGWAGADVLGMRHGLVVAHHALFVQVGTQITRR
jgi:hypothetical protein